MACTSARITGKMTPDEGLNKKHRETVQTITNSVLQEKNMTFLAL
jgi:hypothetical protein